MHANLTGANLKNAQFLNLPGRGICIKTTNFTRANLKNVNLTGAYLYNKDGIKITGEHLRKFLKGTIGIETAIFKKETTLDEDNWPHEEEIIAPNNLLANRPTFEEFKSTYNQDFHSKWLKNPFSTMKWGLMFNVYRTIEDVERYAADNPDTRSHRVLDSLQY